MLWEGISTERRTEVVEVNMKMNADWYICYIIEEHVLQYNDFIGYDSFVLMHDNTLTHVVEPVFEYLEDVRISSLDWPPLNPMYL